MDKAETISLIKMDNLLSLIRILYTLLAALIIIKTHPLSFAAYYAWLVFLIPLALYMSLISLNKALELFGNINKYVFFHGELALLYLLTIILIARSGGASSNYKVVLLLPVLFYSLQFGSRWGYGASFLNMVILNTIFYVKANITVYDLEANLILFAMFFLVSRLAGKGIFLEKIKHWSSGIALRDEVTGLYNEWFLHKKLKQLLEKGRKDLKTGLILIEPYRYSEFQKNWGFCAANIMLKNMAKALNDIIDRKDVVAHCGGGKFAVITREWELAHIIGKGEKLRKQLKNNLERGLEDEWNLPVAVGVAISPDHAGCSASLLQKAEEALARAAVARGNRIQVYYSVFDRFSGQQNRQFMHTAKKIMIAMQARDRVAYAHSEGVLIFTQLICRALRLTEKKAQAIEYAAFLHDIGKMELLKEIPLQQKPLEPVQLKAYRQHPLRGAEILRQQDKKLHPCITAVLHHHERYDGSGYPSRLKGDAIPLGARIIAVSNFFDHITAASPYGQGKTIQEGINTLLQYKNKYFDPLVVEAFVHVLGEYEDIAHIIEWPKDMSRIVPCGYTPHHYILGGHYAEYYFGEIHFMIKAVYCIAAALANGEKCLYIMDELKEKILLQQFEKFVYKGVKICANTRPVQLKKILFPEHLFKTDLKSANFEFEMKKRIKTWMDEAEKEQFSSVRLIIDHSLLKFSGVDLKTWEKLLTRCIKNLDVVVVCFYDIDLVTTDVDIIEHYHHSPMVTATSMLKENRDAR
ncbi:MAG: HD domain-containing phosphohydrolase [Bacillota bacterium]